MSNILEQINSLTEQFSNLFEVEGLGDPASDVPPSTNKIKKDRKTKDGKVELVSVEDELFPYDGNKREQYRQKIIDTINNMIQGTATLEDLLQIVRQKKMPVKEGFEGAIEILENLYKQINKKFNKGEVSIDKSLDLEKKVQDKISPEKRELDSKELDAEMKTSLEPEIKVNKLLKALRRDDKRRNGGKNNYKFTFDYKPVKEGFEGAIELLEEVINEVSDKTAQGALDKAKERYNRKGYEASMKLFQGDSKGAIEDGNKAQDEYNKHINMQLRRAKRQGKKLVQDKNDHDSFKIEEAMKLLEDLESTITKKYGAVFGGKTTPQGQHLHGKAIQAKYDELIDAARRNLPDEKKNSISALDDEVGKINSKRLKTKNKTGEHKTDVRRRSYRKFSDDWGLPKTDNEKIEGSIRRNQEKKAKIEEAQQLLEEIINEVSLKRWKEAADKSAPKRKEEAEKAKDSVMKSWDEYARNSKKYPEEEGDFYVKAVEDGMIGAKAENRAHHADKVKYVTPNSKHSANKYLKAAHNSKDGENEGKNIWAKHIADMDPVKSRTNESCALSELFDRPDLLDDISKTLTNKTIKQHLQNQAKKLLGGKKKKKDIKENFDSFEENNYNIVKLLEELINEVSDGKHRRKLEELKDGIKKAEEFKEATKDNVVKEKIDDIIIPQEHRLEVSQNKYEDRVVKRAQEEYDKNKAKKEKGK